MICPIRTEIEIVPADPISLKSTHRSHSYIIINSSGKTQLRKPRGLKRWSLSRSCNSIIICPVDSLLYASA